MQDMTKDMVAPTAGTVADFSATRIDGRPQALADYAGQVLLVVNVASQCGFTPQYAGLQQLWNDYRARGLVVLGFPCDQFGHQEPGSDDEIGRFCSIDQGVDFPMFAKVEVNGDGEHPLFTWLKNEKAGPRGADIDWNFTKFLLDRDGNVLDRFGPTTTPEEITPEVEKALAAE
jgi:glutathione peroxidase